MPLEELFPTRLYKALLPGRTALPLNAQLLRECRQLRLDDAAGRRWSAANYPGGYTSYGSAHRMHEVSPTFADLHGHLSRHVRRMVGALEWDMRGRRLSMTDCWVNIMPPGVTHGLHLHPLSCLSGTYYVQTPAGSPGLKLEDPRLDRMMAAPPRRRTARRSSRPWVQLPVRPGQILLFESWLRHEVPANGARADRISISFNYGWF
jgi:uncharacterized protein (TIGR02466 family)